MRLLRSFPALAFALVLLSIVGLCAAQESVGLLLIAGTLAAMSWYVTEGPRGRSLPLWVSNLLVIAALLNVPVDWLGHRLEPLGVLGRFTVWLTLIKLYERKEARNYARLMVLSLLMMTIGCIESADLLFGIVLLVYACLGLYVLMLYQLHGAYERAKAHRLASLPEDRLLGPMRPLIGRHVRLQFGSLVGAVGLAGLVLSIVWFVIFPRNLGEGTVNLLRAPTGERRTGYVDEINLTSTTRITESQRVVLTLKLLTTNDTPLPAGQPVYLRGGALERYDGHGVWTRNPSADQRRITTEPPGFALLGAAEPEAGMTVTQRVRMMVASHALFSMGVPVSIATEKAETFDFDPSTLSIRAQGGSTRLDAYQIRAQLAPSDATLRRLMDDRDPSWPAAGRFDDPAVRRLARDLLEAAGLDPDPPHDPAERWAFNRDSARALNDHLRSDEFEYTIDLGDVVLPGGDARTWDPIVHFLFESKRGHCEYFSSALVAMCHCLDIPARVVTGYVTLEYDESAEQYIVRESNAHAWVEVRTGPHRWTKLDPTPPATLRAIHAPRRSFVDGIRWMYDEFEFKWTRGVVGFDGYSQARLYESLDLGWSRRFGHGLQATRDWMSRVNRAFHFGPAGYIWLGLVAFALLIAVLTLIKLMRRSLAIRRTLRLRHLRGAEYQRMLRQLGFYLDMLRVLRRRKFPKPAWQPPLEYARVLADRRPDAGEIVRRITETFYAARYGRQRLTSAEVAHARTLVERLPAALKAKHP